MQSNFWNTQPRPVMCTKCRMKQVNCNCNKQDNQTMSQSFQGRPPRALIKQERDSNVQSQKQFSNQSDQSSQELMQQLLHQQQNSTINLQPKSFLDNGKSRAGPIKAMPQNEDPWKMEIQNEYGNSIKSNQSKLINQGARSGSIQAHLRGQQDFSEYPYGTRQSRFDGSLSQNQQAQDSSITEPKQRNNSKHRIQARGKSVAQGRNTNESPYLLENKFNPNLKEKTIKWFGIENPSGSNNCFLNVVLQSLWHLTRERGLYEYINDVEDYLNQAHQTQTEKKTKQPLIGIIDALHSFYNAIFKQKEISYSRNFVYQPSHLRRELFKLNYSSGQFGLGEAADASETLMMILQMIHASATDFFIQSKALKEGSQFFQQVDVDQNCKFEENKCFVHENFFQESSIRRECRCGNKSEEASTGFNNFQCMVEGFVIVEKIVEQFKALQNVHRGARVDGKFLKSISQSLSIIHKQHNLALEDYCVNNNCTMKQTQTITTLKKPFPQIFSMNISWVQDLTLLETLVVMVSIPFQINLTDMYTISDKDKEDKSSLHFKISGMICYSGAHYICYFKDTEAYKPQAQPRSRGNYLNSTTQKQDYRWRLLNDSLVEGRRSWKEVLEEVVSSRLRPTLVFYEIIESDNSQNIQAESEEFEFSEMELQLMAKKVEEQAKVEEDLQQQRYNVRDNNYHRSYYVAGVSQNSRLRNVNSSVADQSIRSTASNTSNASSTYKRDKMTQDGSKYWEQRLKEIKTKYMGNEIYLFRCPNYKCRFKIILTEDSCAECGERNKMKDYTIEVDQRIVAKCQKELKEEFERAYANDFSRLQNVKSPSENTHSSGFASKSSAKEQSQVEEFKQRREQSSDQYAQERDNKHRPVEQISEQTIKYRSEQIQPDQNQPVYSHLIEGRDEHIHQIQRQQDKRTHLQEGINKGEQVNREIPHNSTNIYDQRFMENTNTIVINAQQPSPLMSHDMSQNQIEDPNKQNFRAQLIEKNISIGYGQQLNQAEQHLKQNQRNNNIGADPINIPRQIETPFNQQVDYQQRANFTFEDLKHNSQINSNQEPHVKKSNVEQMGEQDVIMEEAQEGDKQNSLQTISPLQETPHDADDDVYLQLCLEDSRKEYEQEQRKKQQEESEKLKRDQEAQETEWTCEKCQTLNFIVYEELMSSQCYKCKKFNENIWDLIKQKQNLEKEIRQNNQNQDQDRAHASKVLKDTQARRLTTCLNCGQKQYNTLQSMCESYSCNKVNKSNYLDKVKQKQEIKNEDPGYETCLSCQKQWFSLLLQKCINCQSQSNLSKSNSTSSYSNYGMQGEVNRDQNCRTCYLLGYMCMQCLFFKKQKYLYVSQLYFVQKENRSCKKKRNTKIL